MKRKLLLFLILTSSLFLFLNADNVTRVLKLRVKDKTGSLKEVSVYNRVFGLVVGINKFADKNIKQLNNCVNDAKGVKETLEKYYSIEKIEEIYDEQATSSGILAKLGEMQNKYSITKDDGLFIFVASHGITFNKIGYIVPHDGSFNETEQWKNISMTDLKEKIGEGIIKAKHIFYVIDACYSGSILTRGSGNERIKDDDFAYIQEITKERVRYALTAGDEGQEVLDGGRDGHSVFTGRLIEALEETDSFITSGELSQKISRKVFSDAKDKGHNQKPQYGTLSGLGEFVFLRKEDKTATETAINKISIEEDVMYGSIKISALEDGKIYIDDKVITDITAGRRITLSNIVAGVREIKIEYKDGNIEKKSVTLRDKETINIDYTYVKREQDKTPEGFVFVEGGEFKNIKSAYYNKGVTVSDFYIGKYEVTQKEWVDVMGSAPSYYKGDNLPVEQVSWYDCIEYCNKRSIKEGMTPVYTIDKNKKDPNNTSEYDDIKWTVKANWSANGYRLPTEAEWEYAAGGGQKSNSYTYSGSESLDDVAWYTKTTEDKGTKDVGTKKPNELGIHDMSGNVYEWAWDWYDSSIGTGSNPKGATTGDSRVLRGGSWNDFAGFCRAGSRDYFSPAYSSSHCGFRLSRTSP